MYNIGDYVKLRKVNKSDAQQKVYSKFDLLYEGPYLIAAIPSGNVYTLVDPDTLESRGNFNAIHLFKYYKQ